MKKILSFTLALLLLASLCTLAVSASTIELDNNFGTVNAIYGTPVIDGEIDEAWKEAEMHYVNIPYSPDETTPDPICRFRMMYDETYIYMLTEVYDCTMGDLDWESASVGGNLWKRDSVSFAFDPANDKSETGFAAPSFWFIIGAYGHTANWMDVPQNVFISEDEGATKMYSISYVKDNTGMQIGYIIENKINLTPRHPDFKTIVDTEFGISVACNDNNALIFSATRNELMLLTTANGINKNNSEKMTVKLVNALTTFSHTEEELRFPTPAGVVLEGEEVVTEAPTAAPTAAPTEAPTAAPTDAPTEAPTEAPTDEPTEAPTDAPANTNAPETKPAEEKKGCKSALLPVMLLCVIPAGFVAVKKKRD